MNALTFSKISIKAPFWAALFFNFIVANYVYLEGVVYGFSKKSQKKLIKSNSYTFKN